MTGIALIMAFGSFLDAAVVITCSLVLLFVNLTLQY
jgi:hypothetical protein